MVEEKGANEMSPNIFETARTLRANKQLIYETESKNKNTPEILILSLEHIVQIYEGLEHEIKRIDFILNCCHPVEKNGTIKKYDFRKRKYIKAKLVQDKLKLTNYPVDELGSVLTSFTTDLYHTVHLINDHRFFFYKKSHLSPKQATEIIHNVLNSLNGLKHDFDEIYNGIFRVENPQCLRRGCLYDNSSYSKGSQTRMENAAVILKAIDDLGLREYVADCDNYFKRVEKDPAMAPIEPTKSETVTDKGILTPNTNQSETKGFEKKIELKNREPLDFDPLGSIIQILIHERLAEDELFMKIPKEQRTFIKEKNIIPEDIFSDTMKEALNKQTEKCGEFLRYLEKAKAILLKKPDGQEENIKIIDELMDMNTGQFTIAPPDENADPDEKFSLVLKPPFSHYIEEKYETICKLHQVNINKHRYINPKKIDLAAASITNEHGKKTLELLLRQFEKGAEQYPFIHHRVLTWPFLQKMPLPPREKINEIVQKRRSALCQHNVLTMMPTPFINPHTMATDWFDGSVESMKGLVRFSHLAKEAGKILWESLVKETSQVSNPLLEKEYLDFWIYALHHLRNTYISNDGWDGLFDDDSDFDENEWRKGLYTFRESKDIFLDSSFVCNLLLTAKTELPETSLPGEKPVLDGTKEDYLGIFHRASEQTSVEEVRIMYVVIEFLWRWICRDVPKTKSDFIKAWAELYVTTNERMTKIITWLKWNKIEVANDIEKEYLEFIKFIEKEISDNPVCKDLTTSFIAARGTAIEFVEKLKHVAELAKTQKTGDSGLVEATGSVNKVEKKKVEPTMHGGIQLEERIPDVFDDAKRIVRANPADFKNGLKTITDRILKGKEQPQPKEIGDRFYELWQNARGNETIIIGWLLSDSAIGIGLPLVKPSLASAITGKIAVDDEQLNPANLQEWLRGLIFYQDESKQRLADSVRAYESGKEGKVTEPTTGPNEKRLSTEQRGNSPAEIQNSDREKVQKILRAIDTFLKEYENSEEWLYKEIISKDGHLNDADIFNIIREKEGVVGFSDINFVENPCGKRIDLLLENVRLYLYKTMSTDKTDAFIECVKNCIYHITEDYKHINALTCPWADTITPEERTALHPERRLYRMNLAAELHKAIDDFGLREPAGMDQQSVKEKQTIHGSHNSLLLKNIHEAANDLQKATADEFDYDNLTGQDMAIAVDAVIKYLKERFGEQDDALGNWPRDWHECPEALELWKTTIKNLWLSRSMKNVTAVKNTLEATSPIISPTIATANNSSNNNHTPIDGITADLFDWDKPFTQQQIKEIENKIDPLAKNLEELAEFLETADYFIKGENNYRCSGEVDMEIGELGNNEHPGYSKDAQAWVYASVLSAKALRSELEKIMEPDDANYCYKQIQVGLRLIIDEKGFHMDEPTKQIPPEKHNQSGKQTADFIRQKNSQTIKSKIQNELTPLSPNARAIYDKLCSLKPTEAMTLPAIQDWWYVMKEKNLDEGTFKNYRKELLPYGLKNKRRIGYYIQK